MAAGRRRAGVPRRVQPADPRPRHAGAVEGVLRHGRRPALAGLHRRLRGAAGGRRPPVPVGVAARVRRGGAAAAGAAPAAAGAAGQGPQPLGLAGTAGPGGPLRRVRLRHRRLRRRPGGTAGREVRRGSLDHLIRRRDVVGADHHDHRRVRRHLPGHHQRPGRRGAADDRRGGPARCRHRHAGQLAGRARHRCRRRRGRAARGRRARGAARGDRRAARAGRAAGGAQHASGGLRSRERTAGIERPGPSRAPLGTVCPCPCSPPAPAARPP